MFHLAGRGSVVHIAAQASSAKVTYNLHQTGEQQSQADKRNAATLSQIFGAMEKVDPRLKLKPNNEDAEMRDEEAKDSQAPGFIE